MANDNVFSSAVGVTKQEWDAYSSQVDMSVEKLKGEIGRTARDMKNDIKKDWVYHTPKLKKRARGVTNDLRHIADNIVDRMSTE